MKEEHIPVTAQLLTGMKDAAKKLEHAVDKGDADEIAAVKKELLDLQRELEALI